jgi:acetyl esterase
MPVDPCFAAMLADPRNEARPPPPHVPIEKARRAANAALLGPVGPPLHGVTDFVIPAVGRVIPARLYRPSALANLPVLIFLHGGGWVWGSLDTHDPMCRELARRAGCAVISIEYRLAPETPFPGPADDAYEALKWIAHSAPAVGLDGTRLAIGGDSAGANLAVSAALRARENGPSVRHLGLVYPPLDPACDSPSQREFAIGHILTREVMRWFWRCYLGSDNSGRDPRFAPLSADLSGLPPTTVATAECDILRDEGEAFADRLDAARVPARRRRYAGMIHGFVSFPQITPKATVCLADIADDLRLAFAPPSVEDVR